MLQDRYETDKFFEYIYQLTNEMDPVLVQIDVLLDDEELCTSSEHLGYLGMINKGDSHRHKLIIHRPETGSVDGVRPWFLA